MDKPKIILITCGNFEKELILEIAEKIRLIYDYPVEERECYIDLSEYYNPARRQYNANSLLNIINEFTSDDSIKTVGLFRVDLYIPVLTYIFGQAILSGETAIASLYRLKNELYGLEKNENLLQDRFIKVVIHELGHAFGLPHCLNPVCVMRSGTYVEDLDQKDSGLCIKCLVEFERLNR